MKQFFKSQTCGIITALVLVLLMCESRLFNFLINSFLGKLILIGLVMYFSYIHKILGIVVVLFVIIIFNNNNMAYYEGFEQLQDASGNIQDASGNIKKAKIKQNNDDSDNTTGKGTNGKGTTGKGTNGKGTKLKAAKMNNNNSDSLEGFDMISTENNMRKGKNSNSIPVDPFMNASTSITPYEGSNNVESFSTF